MKENFRYCLDNSPRKFICPGCGKRRFVKYVDRTTGEYLPERFGRCDRVINCSYHLNPYKDGFGKNPNGTGTRPRWNPPPQEPPKPPTFIDIEIFKASRAGYDQNNFVLWLTRLFDYTTVNNLISLYNIGTSKHWPGAVVFWQIDKSGQIRSGKIMGYNPTTGHRIKEPQPQITWVHKALKLPDFTLKQCYFGEHLLKLEPLKPVAIVESEKTAIVASAYLPNFIWLAVGSLTNLNIEKCKPLAGRKVVLFPDGNGFEKWKAKAAEIQKAMPGTRFDVSDLLERNATENERENGLDLVDYLIKFDLGTFTQEPEPLKSEKGEKSESLKTNYLLPDLIRLQFKNWNPYFWIIEPARLPGITKYNLQLLSQDINYKHGLTVTPGEYLTAYQQTILN